MISSCQDRPSSSSEVFSDPDISDKHVEINLVGCNFFNVFSEMSSKQSMILNAFPWVSEFHSLAKTDLSSSVKGLLTLMDFFLEKASMTVKQCYSRPKRATKLKIALTGTLMFFHLTYLDLKHLASEQFTYFEKMSDLMALYLDMEIKASRTATECSVKIASRITSSFYLYFGQSPSYIIDTIFKAKYIAKNAETLLVLIFRRALRDFDGSNVDGLTYVRYLFAFKTWKIITKLPEEKSRIVKQACAKLRPPPGFIEALRYKKELQGLLPVLPKYCSCPTLFLMKIKFSVKDCLKVFFKLANDPFSFLYWHTVRKENPVMKPVNKKSCVFELIKELQDDVHLNTLSKQTAIKTQCNHQCTRLCLGRANKLSMKKNNNDKDTDIIDLDNSSLDVQADHLSSVQDDLDDPEDDDLVITSNLSEEDKAKLDEIYNATIDSCVKTNGDVEGSHISDVLNPEALVSSNHSNLYVPYEDPVASTTCLKEGLVAFINDTFSANLIDYSHPMATLNDVAATMKDELFMLNCKNESPELVTSTSPQRKSLTINPISQEAKDDKLNYDSLSFPANQFLLIQNEEKTKSGDHSCKCAEKDKSLECIRNLPNEDPIVILSPADKSKEGITQLKAFPILKQNSTPSEYYSKEQDLLKLAFSSKSVITGPTGGHPGDFQGHHLHESVIRGPTGYPIGDLQGQHLGEYYTSITNQYQIVKVDFSPTEKYIGESAANEGYEQIKESSIKLPEISPGDLADNPHGDLVEEPPGKALENASSNLAPENLSDLEYQSNLEGSLQEFLVLRSGFRTPTTVTAETHREPLILPIKKKILRRKPMEKVVEAPIKKIPEKQNLKQKSSEKIEKRHLHKSSKRKNSENPREQSNELLLAEIVRNKPLDNREETRIEKLETSNYKALQNSDIVSKDGPECKKPRHKSSGKKEKRHLHNKCEGQSNKLSDNKHLGRNESDQPEATENNKYAYKVVRSKSTERPEKILDEKDENFLRICLVKLDMPPEESHASSIFKRKKDASQEKISESISSRQKSMEKPVAPDELIARKTLKEKTVGKPENRSTETEVRSHDLFTTKIFNRRYWKELHANKHPKRKDAEKFVEPAKLREEPISESVIPQEERFTQKHQKPKSKSKKSKGELEKKTKEKSKKKKSSRKSKQEKLPCQENTRKSSRIMKTKTPLYRLFEEMEDSDDSSF